MGGPSFLVRGLSKNPDDFRIGERVVTEWWTTNREWIALNVWIAAAGAAITAIVVVAIGPLQHPGAFYGIAAQVIPAFLIALAVERSLLDSLGTKADYARRAREEALDTYHSPGINGGIIFTIEIALMNRLSAAIANGRVADVNIPVTRADIAKAAITARPDDDALTWDLLRSRLGDECGLPADDPDPFEEPGPYIDLSPGFAALTESVTAETPGESIRWLAVLAALRHEADLTSGWVEGPTILTELKRLHAAVEQRKQESFLSRITYRANLEYDRQRRRRTISLRCSIVLLTITELATMVGLVSPHRPDQALFVITASLVAASILNVAGGALADLQSTGGRTASTSA